MNKPDKNPEQKDGTHCRKDKTQIKEMKIKNETKNLPNKLTDTINSRTIQKTFKFYSFIVYFISFCFSLDNGFVCMRNNFYLKMKMLGF